MTHIVKGHPNVEDNEGKWALSLGFNISIIFSEEDGLDEAELCWEGGLSQGHYEGKKGALVAQGNKMKFEWDYTVYQVTINNREV